MLFLQNVKQLHSFLDIMNTYVSQYFTISRYLHDRIKKEIKSPVDQARRRCFWRHEKCVNLQPQSRLIQTSRNRPI